MSNTEPWHGWKNKETWLVYLQFSNDRHTQELAEKIAHNAERIEMASAGLREWVYGFLDTLPGKFPDLFRISLEHVDWTAIAEHFRE